MLSIQEQTYWNPYTERTEHKWAATEYGLVVSRQNGKGSILEARELAGLFLFGERLIIHSAHQFDTSLEAFGRILMLIENTPDLDSEVTRVVRNHGEEGIELKSGQRLRFRTRTKGGGRGFTADCVIFDEAMLSLKAQQIGAILPTVSARPNAQMIYTGSAGTQESEHFGAVRARAIKGGDPYLGYDEWSIVPCSVFCPPDCEEHDRPEDPRSHAKANPAYGIRISGEHVMKEFRSMSREEFLRERCGVGDWPAEGDGWHVISKEAWERRNGEGSRLKGKFCVAVDTAPNEEWTTIATVGQNEDREIYGEITGFDVFDYRRGIRWALPRLLDIWRTNRPAFVVINPETPASQLIDPLEAKGVKVLKPTVREYAQGCNQFRYGVAPKPGEEADFLHGNQAPLNAAVANASKRQIRELWAWDKLESAADITSLTTMTLGYWGFKKHLYAKSVAPWAMRG